MTSEGRINCFGRLAAVLCGACTLSAIVSLNTGNYLGGACQLVGSWVDGILALVAFERARKHWGKGVR